MAESLRDLWEHKDLKSRLGQHKGQQLVNKVKWAELQLALEGRTPIVKGTTGHSYPWRRTPVQGNDFYLWWIPARVSGTAELDDLAGQGSIFVREVRPHDDTDKPLPLGTKEDYVKEQVHNLDPRYPDQREVGDGITSSHRPMVKVINGHPGSGKTVALQFAACEFRHTDQKVLYVTFTLGLAERAKRFFQLQQLENQVRVCTFEELLQEVLEENPTQDLRLGKPAFESFADHISRYGKQNLGQWHDYRKMLWIEIRAYLLGMALPFSWKRQGKGTIQASKDVLDHGDYLRLREDYLDHETLDTAHQVACQIAENDKDKARSFPQQHIARLALDRIVNRGIEGVDCLDGVRALIIDEIQDLTLLQIALLVELSSIAGKEAHGFTFLAAGDESQTLYPSGFDWGVVKDLFTDRLGVTPSRAKLPHQRRSPRRIAKLIQDSWELYREHVPYQNHPKSLRDVRDEDEIQKEDEAVFCWQLDDKTNCPAIFEELANYPGIALVRLGEALPSSEMDVPESAARISYIPEQIKGLDRKIVFVLGLEKEIASLHDDHKNGQVAALHKRRAIDSIRVALSRSTHTLVLPMKERDAVVQALGLEDIVSAGWAEVHQHLQEQLQDMTVFDQVYLFLYQANEALLADDLTRAQDENESARILLNDMKDPDLEQTVSEQRKKIDQALLKRYLTEAGNCLHNEEYELAGDILEKCQPLIDGIQDLELARQWQGYGDAVKLWRTIEIATGELNSRQYTSTYVKYKNEIVPALAQANNPHLRDRANDVWDQLQPKLDSIAGELWKQAQDARENEQWHEAADWYRWMATIRKDKAEGDKADALDCLADRYENLPPPLHASSVDVSRLLVLLERYMSAAERVDALTHEDARSLVNDWLKDLFVVLGRKPDLYLECRDKLCETLRRDGLSFAKSDHTVQTAATEAVAGLRQVGLITDAIELLTLFPIDVPASLKEAGAFLDEMEELKSTDWFQGLTPAEKETLAHQLELRAEELRNVTPS